jgi:hypothetical protein
MASPELWSGDGRGPPLRFKNAAVAAISGRVFENDISPKGTAIREESWQALTRTPESLFIAYEHI